MAPMRVRFRSRELPMNCPGSGQRRFGAKRRALPDAAKWDPVTHGPGYTPKDRPVSRGNRCPGSAGRLSANTARLSAGLKPRCTCWPSVANCDFPCARLKDAVPLGPEDCAARRATSPHRHPRTPAPPPRPSRAHPPPATLNPIRVRPPASCRRKPAPRCP